jgi:uncharacterized protein YPO0396
MTDQLDFAAAALETSAQQFRLARVQLFNWGTFSGVTDLQVAPAGYLFVGPSGSGKSTILDAHATLLTPRKWLDFNVAAREADRKGADRSMVTYVRGAYKQATEESGEIAAQYLRTETTWSSIAECYRNGVGQVVTIAQVLWLRGKTTAANDVHRLFIVSERELDVTDFRFFAASDFDQRQFKVQLPDAYVTKEFSAYQERFRSLLGIDTERALRLLHKTQSAKNLGDLNMFMREFMLDEPEAFAVADSLVTEFVQLETAYNEVVAAREQIDLLKPVQQKFFEHQSAGLQRNTLKEVEQGAEFFGGKKRYELLESQVEHLAAELSVCRQQLEPLAEIRDGESEKLRAMQLDKSQRGGAVLERLEREKKEAEARLPNVKRLRESSDKAFSALEWEVPRDVEGFARATEAAKGLAEMSPGWQQEFQSRFTKALTRQSEVNSEIVAVQREVTAMQEHPSNIPADYLRMRRQMCQDLGLNEMELPFAGELIEVRKGEEAWRGAIERVLRGLALSLLVDERNYAAVVSYLEETDTGLMVRYNRMMAHHASATGISPKSLFSKLNLKACAQQQWLREELKSQYADLVCADTVQEFRAARRALTLKGQIKHSAVRHEKNDRDPVNNRSRWLLGFDNREKLALFQERGLGLLDDKEKADAAVDGLAKEQQKATVRAKAAGTLENMRWADIDVDGLVTHIRDLGTQLEAEKKQRPDLEELDRKIATQKTRAEGADKNYTDTKAKEQNLVGALGLAAKEFDAQSLMLELGSLTPTQQLELEERLANVKLEVTLSSLDRAMGQVVRSIKEDDRKLELSMLQLEHAMVQAFTKFNAQWPVASGGLDANFASASDYIEKLVSLQKDGLFRFEEKFLKMLGEQSDRNLALLSSKLENERNAIGVRLELVNEGLLTAPYNPGTHLVIQSKDRQLEEVRDFKQSLRAAMTNTFVGGMQEGEQRFKTLRELVGKLGKHEDVAWRKLVLDVRQHVDFLASEREDDTDREVEVYSSGAGKSGGQRQKLTATCLASALRYQLGGQDRALPLFSTVVLDEAFDKTDPEYTAMAMNIFKNFGFQLIVATPMKSVMTMEPFIGGACYVENRDRKSSRVLLIDYDIDTRRLKLSQNLLDADQAAVS